MKPLSELDARDVRVVLFDIDDTLTTVGDSPNDASMFSFFAKSVGVANVRRFAGRMPHEPSYVTPSAFGAGFAELVQHLLQA